MDILKNQINSFLDSNDSSPGAHIFVLANLREVDDDEVAQIYEQSEGENDLARESLINSMTNEQLLKLAAEILEIANEKLNS